MYSQHTRRRAVAGVWALVALGLLAAPAGASGKPVQIKQVLSATGVDPDAQGQVVVVVVPGRHAQGKLDVKVRRLDRKAQFEVVLQGVRIGALTTDGGGNGRASFRTRPRGRDQLLGTDPRGMTIDVRDAAGEDVLTGDIADAAEDPTKIRCCLADDGGTACEDRTADECTAQGGVNMGAGSCVPSPCEQTPPPPVAEQIRCCIPDDQGPECEDRTAARCSAENGINVGAGPCDPNPCAPTPSPDLIQCCTPEDQSGECELRTADRCTARGGANLGTGSCTPNPCALPPPPPPEEGKTRCCVPHHEGPECEDRTPAQCTAEGGTDIGAGSCVPNPCQ